MKNWKTTTSGILTALVAIITAVVLPLLNDQSLNGDAIVTAVMSIITALGLICARDSGNGDGGDAQGSDQTARTLKALAKRLNPLLVLAAISLCIASCKHAVTVTATPDGAVITQGDKSLTIDKEHQLVTWTQHPLNPPMVDPVLIIQPSK